MPAKSKSTKDKPKPKIGRPKGSKDKKKRKMKPLPKHQKTYKAKKRRLGIGVQKAANPFKRKCEPITNAGKRCTQWAVPHTIFCVIHGGGRPHPKSKGLNEVVRGAKLYIKTMNLNEQEVFHGIFDDLNVKPELSLLRVKLQTMLEEYGPDWIPTRSHMNFLTRTISRLASVAERVGRTAEGIRVKVQIDRVSAKELFDVVKEYVPRDRWAECAKKLVSIADAASGGELEGADAGT